MMISSSPMYFKLALKQPHDFITYFDQQYDAWILDDSVKADHGWRLDAYLLGGRSVIFIF